MSEDQDIAIRIDHGNIALSWKVDQIIISPEAMRVYIHLYHRAANNKDKAAWPSMRSIGIECFPHLKNADSQKRVARKAIEELQILGMVEVKKQFNTDTNSYQSNRYILHGADHYVPIAVRKNLVKKYLLEYERNKGFLRDIPKDPPTPPVTRVEIAPSDKFATREGQKSPTPHDKNVTPKTKREGQKNPPLLTKQSPPSGKTVTTLVAELPPPSDSSATTLVANLPPKVVISEVPDQEVPDQEALDKEDRSVSSYEETAPDSADASLVSPSAVVEDRELDPWELDPNCEAFQTSEQEGKLVEVETPETETPPATDWTFDEYVAHGYHPEQIPFWSDFGRRWNHPVEDPPMCLNWPMPEPDPRLKDPKYIAFRERAMKRLAEERAQEEAEERAREQARKQAQEALKMPDPIPATPEPASITPAAQKPSKKMTQEEGAIAALLLDFGRFLATHPELRLPIMPLTETERPKWLKVVQPYLRTLGPTPLDSARQLAKIMTFAYWECVNNIDNTSKVSWYTPTIENLLKSRDHYNSVAARYKAENPNDDLDLNGWFSDIDGTSKRLRERLKANASGIERT